MVKTSQNNWLKKPKNSQPPLQHPAAAVRCFWPKCHHWTRVKRGQIPLCLRLEIAHQPILPQWLAPSQPDTSFLRSKVHRRALQPQHMNHRFLKCIRSEPSGPSSTIPSSSSLPFPNSKRLMPLITFCLILWSEFSTSRRRSMRRSCESFPSECSTGERWSSLWFPRTIKIFKGWWAVPNTSSIKWLTCPTPDSACVYSSKILRRFGLSGALPRSWVQYTDHLHSGCSPLLCVADSRNRIPHFLLLSYKRRYDRQCGAEETNTSDLSR